MPRMVKNYYPYLVIALSVFSINLISFQTFAVEEIWEDYEKMGEMVKDIKNGDKDDDKVDYNKLKNSTVYKNASADIRTCIDLANKVGEKLGDYEIVHCFENTNYFKEKYVDDEVDQNTEQVVQQGGANQNMTGSNAVSDADHPPEQEQQQQEQEQQQQQEQEQQQQQEQEQQQQQEKSTSNTSGTDSSTSYDVTENNFIDELVRTGKFTEDEAKEFVNQNILRRAEITPTLNDTSYANDTQANGTEIQQVEQVDQNETRPEIMTNASQSSRLESNTNSTEGCDSSYPEICITTYSAKLICADIPFRNFTVLLPDPHGFDSDGDGTGCEESAEMLGN
jgi:polyhydroxyalkanoate synthesis regulator phasin